MKLFLIVSLLFITVPAFVSGQKGPDVRIAEELMQLERDWITASLKRDRRWLEQFFADELTVTHPGIGRVTDKAQEIADSINPANTPDSMTLGEMKVRLAGNTAVVTGTAFETGGGGHLTDRNRGYLFTDTFIFRDGRWQLLASHSSRLPRQTDPRIYRLAEMNVQQIKNLNKEKTVVILPGGILEQHGPFLPTFTDGYWNEQVTQDLAAAIAAKPGWSVVIFPTIPLGNSGANDIAGNFSFPGTYAVRFETLRSIFMDLATELGEQRFKWIFVVHGHGAPNHVRALDQAGDYFRDVYRGRMVNLTGLLPVISLWDGKKSDEERKEDGLPIHAGMDETSMMLALRPGLVDPNYKSAKPFASDTMENLIGISKSRDWPGYFGSPRLAAAEKYADGWQRASHEAISLALKTLDGADARTIPRFGDEMKKSPPDVALDKAALKHEAQIKRKQDAWLKKKRLN
jgi:creatinine amidohydrolase